MARFYCTVPDINISTEVIGIKLLENANKVVLSGPTLSVELSNGLSDKNYDKISKQVRITIFVLFRKKYTLKVMILTSHLPLSALQAMTRGKNTFFRIRENQDKNSLIYRPVF
jgi:hypothetical protein